MCSVYRFLDYELYDPVTPKGRARIAFLSEVFRRILEPFASRWSERGSVDAIDVCCGRGIGAAALVEALRSLGIEPRVTLVDRRREAVEFAESFVRSELRVDTRSAILDAEEVFRVGERFDIAIMAGFSSIHFDPWRMVKLSAAISEILRDDGVFIMEEIDRLYKYVSRGLKDVSLARIASGRVLIALHEPGDYDPSRGAIKVVLVDVCSGDMEELEIHPWSIGGIAAMLWTFFQRVSVVEEGEIGYIVAEKPRRVTRASDIAREEIPVEAGREE
ncbi:MAG: class I SAM-dependent methyltransferase [Crenarchaeota archaeon]|nr:class I SAM-dependent methyltransferase [Thermoproteota archaeon]